MPQATVNVHKVELQGDTDHVEVDLAYVDEDGFADEDAEENRAIVTVNNDGSIVFQDFEAGKVVKLNLFDLARQRVQDAVDVLGLGISIQQETIFPERSKPEEPGDQGIFHASAGGCVRTLPRDKVKRVSLASLKGYEACGECLHGFVARPGDYLMVAIIAD